MKFDIFICIKNHHLTFFKTFQEPPFDLNFPNTTNARINFLAKILVNKILDKKESHLFRIFVSQPCLSMIFIALAGPLLAHFCSVSSPVSSHTCLRSFIKDTTSQPCVWHAKRCLTISAAMWNERILTTVVTLYEGEPRLPRSYSINPLKNLIWKSQKPWKATRVLSGRYRLWGIANVNRLRKDPRGPQTSQSGKQFWSMLRNSMKMVSIALT